jgi:hypothetical protein
MGKRPFYIITTEIDCEGYDVKLDYLTNDYNKLKRAYEAIYTKRRHDYFVAEGIDEDYIYGNFVPLPNSPKEFMKAGGINCYLNDDNCCWITIRCHIRYTDTYPPGYNLD